MMEFVATNDNPAEIALIQAQALANETNVERDAERQWALVVRIGELLEQHNTAEIALCRAQALFNAIDLMQAQGLFNGRVLLPDKERRRVLDTQIRELLEQHNTAEIALVRAKALANQAVGEPWGLEGWVKAIGKLLERHNTAEIALCQALVLYNATVAAPDMHPCLALAERIGKLLERHNTAEIALCQARALYNATVGERDMHRCLALAERIGKLLEQHNTAEIALCQVNALHNAAVNVPLLSIRRRLSLMIRTRHARKIHRVLSHRQSLLTAV
jgi:hypothetical protein